MKITELGNNTANNGTYGSVIPSGVAIDIIKNYQEQLDVKYPIPSNEFHCTIMYSREPVNSITTPYYLPCNAVITGIDVLDNDALVLLLTAPALEARWKELTNLGASWDYDGFTPHISLSYNSEDFKLASKGLPDLPKVIQFTSELIAPLDLD